MPNIGVAVDYCLFGMENLESEIGVGEVGEYSLELVECLCYRKISEVNAVGCCILEGNR